jgi:hypothetical protein
MSAKCNGRFFIKDGFIFRFSIENLTPSPLHTIHMQFATGRAD